MQRKKGHLKSDNSVTESSAFQAKLQFEFDQKRLKNPSLSLRDFARLLDMPVSTLTMLMRAKAQPTRTTIVKIANKLGWQDVEVQDLIQQATVERNARRIYGNQFRPQAPDRAVLERLLNLAIMTLSRVENHPASPSFIAAKLGVSLKEVTDSLELLQSRGLVEIIDGMLKAPEQIPAFVGDPADEIIINYKRKFLSRALEQLDSKPVKQSNSVLFYFSASASDLEMVQNRLGIFMRNILSSLKPSKDDELYCGGALYFPFKK